MGRAEHRLSGGLHHVGVALVDRGRGQQAQAPVVMLVVLPMKELRAEVQAVFVAGEAVRELGPVLQCLELALRERVVVGDVRPAVGRSVSTGLRQLRFEISVAR